MSVTGALPGRRFRIASPATAVAVGVLMVAMTAAVVVVGSLAHRVSPAAAAEIALLFAFGLVGFIVALHQPGNPMGWVLLGVGFFLLLDALAGVYAVFDYRLHHGSLPLGGLGCCSRPPGRRRWCSPVCRSGGPGHGSGWADRGGAAGAGAGPRLGLAQRT